MISNKYSVITAGAILKEVVEEVVLLLLMVLNLDEDIVSEVETTSERRCECL